MTKKYKQYIHRKWMQTKMHDIFKNLGISYYNFGVSRNQCYWFQCDEITTEQKELIRKSHKYPNLVHFGITQKQYAPEITSKLMYLIY